MYLGWFYPFCRQKWRYESIIKNYIKYSKLLKIIKLFLMAFQDHHVKITTEINITWFFAREGVILN